MNKIQVFHKNYTCYTLYRRGSYYHADAVDGCRKYRAINAPREWWNVTDNGQCRFKDADTIDTLEAGVAELLAQHPNGHTPTTNGQIARRLITHLKSAHHVTPRESKGKGRAE